VSRSSPPILQLANCPIFSGQTDASLPNTTLNHNHSPVGFTILVFEISWGMPGYFQASRATGSFQQRQDIRPQHSHTPAVPAKRIVSIADGGKNRFLRANHRGDERRYAFPVLGEGCQARNSRIPYLKVNAWLNRKKGSVEITQSHQTPHSIARSAHLSRLRTLAMTDTQYVQGHRALDAALLYHRYPAFSHVIKRVLVPLQGSRVRVDHCRFAVPFTSTMSPVRTISSNLGIPPTQGIPISRARRAA